MFKNNLTTISFEGAEIRTVIIQGKRITGWHTRSLPLEQISRGLILDPEGVSAEIKDTLKELKGSRRNVISSVSGIRSVHRIMRIPSIPEKLLRETVERKARQEFAIPIEDTDLSWRIISQQDNHLILYVLAVPKNMIDQQVEALKGAGIRSREMDIKPLALTRITNRETAIIVNLEDHSMGVIIMVRHVPMLIRSIPLESGDLTGEAKTDLLSQELARTTKYFNESH
ncbi:MAG: type IV pilus biogenesis protein PilM, partial [Anaerolineales bacterium]